MLDINKIMDYEYQLWSALESSSGEIVQKVWEEIRKDEEVLRGAIQVTKNKFQEDKLVAPIIGEFILRDYKNVDSDIYKELVDTIYSHKNIARKSRTTIGLGKLPSYLSIVLANHDLELTGCQKNFAVEEALFQAGTAFQTTMYEEYKAEKSGKAMNSMNTIRLGLSNYPIDAKKREEYFHDMFKTVQSKHGSGAFDIRYEILMNPNWSIEEKANLVYDFYENDEKWDETLDAWELGIVNEPVNFEGAYSCMYKVNLYKYSHDTIAERYQDSATADRIFEEISLCKLFHQMRPQQWEVAKDDPVIYTKTKND